MRVLRWMMLIVAGVALAGLCGCEGGGDDNTDTTTPTSTDDTTNQTPVVRQFVNETFNLSSNTTEYSTGKYTAPWAGTILAHIKCTSGQNVQGWIVKVTGGTKSGGTIAPEMNLSAATAKGEQWKVQIDNVDTADITVQLSFMYSP